MCAIMVDSDRMDRIESGLHSVEMAMVKLTVLAEEGAKREERMNKRMDERMDKIDERLDKQDERMSKMDDRTQENTKMLWKFLGVITGVTFITSLLIGFL